MYGRLYEKYIIPLKWHALLPIFTRLFAVYIGFLALSLSSQSISSVKQPKSEHN